MNQQLMNLINLQDIAAEIYAIKGKAEKIPAIIADLEEKVREHRNNLALHKQELEEAKALKREKEAGVEENKQRLEENKAKNFKISTPREFEAITAENATLTKEMQTLESELVDVMATIENLENAIAEEEKNIAAEEKNIEGDKKRHLKQLDEYESEAARLRKAAEKVEKDISPRYVSLFHRIADRRQGNAVVECVDGICQGCRMKSRLQVWTEIARNHKIMQCFSCQRILYRNTSYIDEHREFRNLTAVAATDADETPSEE